MNPDEKYKEIVESRKVATGADDNPSGVKADPPAEQKPNPEQKPGATFKPEEEKDEAPAKPEPTEAEKMQHALSELRFSSSREIKELKKIIQQQNERIAQLSPKEPKKTRADFQSDEEYGKHIRSEMESEITEKLTKQFEEQRARESEAAEFNRTLQGEIDKIKPGLGELVMKDLNDPNSVMSQIITHENAGAIVKAVKASPRRGDLLALMQQKPQIFQSMLNLSEDRQAYRLYQLEDAIDSMYAKADAQQKADKEKQDRAASLPAPGSFGTHGTGTSDISGLSTEERVNRYKAEMRKKNR